MKKALFPVLMLVIIVMSACATTPKAKPIIAVSLVALDNPLMLQMQDAFINEFGDEYDVQVASADNNPINQATQIENFTAMNVKLLFVLPVEPTSLASRLVAAREAGIQVLVAGGESGKTSRDAVMKMDQFLAGEYAAMMAKEWVEKTYPNAEAGSIETAVLTSTTNEEAVARTNGLLMISEPYLKNDKGEYIDTDGKAISDVQGKYHFGKSASDRVTNPVYTPAVSVVTTVEAMMFQDGQLAMQNVLTTTPNVKLVLAYASDGGNGASKAIMDEYGKTTGSVITSIDKIAVFGVGLFGPEGDAIVDSSLGKGVFRGAVAFGGGDLPASTVALAKLMLEGNDYPEVTWDPLALATVVEGKLTILPVANSGVILPK
jgi:ABC-type sugar transport system substrate-binding protein